MHLAPIPIVGNKLTFSPGILGTYIRAAIVPMRKCSSIRRTELATSQPQNFSKAIVRNKKKWKHIYIKERKGGIIYTYLAVAAAAAAAAAKFRGALVSPLPVQQQQQHRQQRSSWLPALARARFSRLFLSLSYIRVAHTNTRISLSLSIPLSAARTNLHPENPARIRNEPDEDGGSLCPTTTLCLLHASERRIAL